MTTGDPTPSDFDFDAFMHEAGVALEISKDRGLVDFEENRAAVQDEINSNRGILSPYYSPVIDELNQLWEFHEQIATICGKVYLKDEHEANIKYFVEMWGEPSHDELGMFWVCTDARLQSFGIIDVAREKDESTDARFVYAFGLEGDVEDDPCLVVHLDSATMEFDTITDRQVAEWLKENYPDLFIEINQIVEQKPSDYTKSIRNLQNLVKQIENDLSESTELGTYLSRYVAKLLAFSNELPCVVELAPGEVFEVQDDDANWVKVDFPDGSTEIVTTPDIDIAESHAGFVVGFPDTSGAAVRVGFIPLEAIGRMYATTPRVSILDRAIRGMQKDVVGRLDTLGSGDAKLTHIEVTPSSSRERFEAMQLAQDGLNEMYALAVNFARSARYKTAAEAYAAAGGVGAEISRRAMQTGVNNYRIVVSGKDVVLPPGLEIDGSLENDGLGISDEEKTDSMSGITIKRSTEARHLEEFEESLVSAVGIFVKPVQIEEDPEVFSAEFYVRGSRATAAMQPYEANEVPVVDVFVHEIASIPLEGTAKLTIDGYERAKEIFAQIENLNKITKGGTLLSSMSTFYDAIVDADGTDSVSPEGILHLEAVAEYYRSSDNAKAKDGVAYVLGLMLNSRTVDLKTIVGTDDTLHGTVIDVSEVSSGELALTVQDEADNLHMIPLSTIAALVVA